ncbi:serine/threonine-protein kinase-like protein [Canna indica]|uniref:Serine/threonine-protein kinase-like protein n=1 Tax=Canna indica TaxID=4628 RepID=A0AAQ3KDT2_9LILI|nr:serine/threonine-protein kinase-like protein [Canna indica]
MCVPPLNFLYPSPSLSTSSLLLLPSFLRHHHENKMMEISFEDIKTATGGFSLEYLVGKGSHGSVYKGTLKDGRLVAVKKPLERVRDHDLKLSNEIGVLTSLKKNPFIVNLIGVSESATNTKLLVLEFMRNGSLHDLLHSSPRPLSWPRRAAVALQIARAVLSLHEAAPAPVIHRDIKSANILFDGKWNARLADFSLAVAVDDGLRVDEYSAAIPAGTIGYLDPSYTESGKLGPKNDVFSFGVVLLELVSARKVMNMDCDPSSIVAWALPLIEDGRLAEVCDRKVPLPDYMKRPIRDMLSVAELCVSEKVERRPLMGEVVKELQRVVDGIMTLSSVRSRISERVHRCVQAWRRCVKKRITTTRIVCRNHLADDDAGSQARVIMEYSKA